MSGPRWASFLGCGDQLTAADLRRLRRFNAWVLAWALSFVGSMFVLTRFETLDPFLRWGLIVVSTLLGGLACSAYLKFLREADELLRKIQLEGLALGFGAGAIFMTAYALAEQAGAPPLTTSDPMAVMFLAWAIGQWRAARRYR